MPNLVPLEPLFEAFGGWGLEDGLPFKKKLCIFQKNVYICSLHRLCVFGVLCWNTGLLVENNIIKYFINLKQTKKLL